jgi:protein N-lysine methyltransferase METTL21A
LVGLAVAQACRLKTKLLLTDQLEMLELMEHNIILNELTDCVDAMILNWCVLER